MYNETRRAAWAEVSLGSIRENFLAVRGLAKGCEIIACLKADAYGHGIVKTAWELVRESADYLGVATLDEAVAIRSAGISTKVVLMSPVPRNNVKDVMDLQLIPVVTTYEDARLLSDMAVRAGKKDKARFFLALDTGMGRLGFTPTPEAFRDISMAVSLPGISLLGFFSHFATADEPNLAYARHQLDVFRAFEARLREEGIMAGKRTMANSAAIMALPESHLDIVRPGIALYGVYPSSSMDKNLLPLKPALSVKSNIIYLKKVPPRTSISYERRFTTERESLIATLPIGYGDGLPRIATNRARIIVRGHYAPLVGTICMDLCMADVTDVPGVSEYDEAVLLGEQEGNAITAEELAANSATNAYEVVTRLGQRLPRRYI